MRTKVIDLHTPWRQHSRQRSCDQSQIINSKIYEAHQILKIIIKKQSQKTLMKQSEVIQCHSPGNFLFGLPNNLLISLKQILKQYIANHVSASNFNSLVQKKKVDAYKESVHYYQDKLRQKENELTKKSSKENILKNQYQKKLKEALRAKALNNISKDYQNISAKESIFIGPQISKYLPMKSLEITYFDLFPQNQQLQKSSIKISKECQDKNHKVMNIKNNIKQLNSKRINIIEEMNRKNVQYQQQLAAINQQILNINLQIQKSK